MTRDDSKLAYYSNWDIDQLVATGEVQVSSGSTAIYTITGTNPIPEFEVQFKPTGSTFWYQEGRSASSATLATLLDFSTYILSGRVFITAPSAGTARYFVWVDKVDY